MWVQLRKLETPIEPETLPPPPDAFIQPLEEWLPDPLVTKEPLSPNSNSSYVVEGQTFDPWGPITSYEEIGVATWRDRRFDGITAFSGEIFDTHALMAAHRYLPLPSYLRVTNPKNDRSTIVRVNDRGPFRDSGIIDLSEAAASKLDLIDAPKPIVHVTLVNHGDLPVYSLETDSIFGRENVDQLVYKFALLQHVNTVVVPQNEDNWYRIRLGPFSNVDDAQRVRGWGILNANTESTILEE